MVAKNFLQVSRGCIEIRLSKLPFINFIILVVENINNKYYNNIGDHLSIPKNSRKEDKNHLPNVTSSIRYLRIR